MLSHDAHSDGRASWPVNAPESVLWAELVAFQQNSGSQTSKALPGSLLDALRPLVLPQELVGQ